VVLYQLKLGGVLDGDDPLVERDEAGQDVEDSRLAWVVLASTPVQRSARRPMDWLNGWAWLVM
jgi:hypothetical protein